MKKYITITTASLLMPLMASAQLTGTRGFILRIMDLVELLIVLVAALALLAFFFGLMKFIFKVGGDEKAIEQGRNLMKWGVIALFVMMSVWGIIRFFQDEFDLDTRPIDISDQVDL